MVILLIIFSLVLLLVFFEDYLGKYKWAVYIVVGIIMILCAGLRPVGFDRDSENYEYFFLHPDSGLSEISVEPLFLIICRILYFLYPDVQSLLLFFASLSITLKLLAIRKITPLFLLPIVIYFANFYLLHDLTQIRAGIVSGLFLLSLPYLSDGGKKIPLCLVLIGALFHFSALALLPLLFLNNNKIQTKYKIVWVCIVPICFILYALDLDLLTTVPIPYVTDKVESYKMMSEFGNVNKESILNPFPLMKMTVFLYFLYFSNTIEPYVPSINLIIKILGCSLLVYFAFSSVKIVSTRISELYGIVEIVAYPCVFYTIQPRIIGKILVCIMGLIEIYFNVFQWGFFDF